MKSTVQDGSSLVAPIPSYAGPVLTTIALDSEEWLTWLEQESSNSFSYEPANSEGATFTARREKKDRGGYYWVAYKKIGRTTKKAYLGKSKNVTKEKLAEVSKQFDQSEVTQHPEVVTQHPEVVIQPENVKNDVQLTEAIGILKELLDSKKYPANKAGAMRSKISEVIVMLES